MRLHCAGCLHVIGRVEVVGERAHPGLDIPIRQGDLFLLPPNIPHSPQRPANTVGLVIEQARPVQADDHLRWYCRKCGSVVYDAGFHLEDLGKQLKPIIEEFNGSPALRTCRACHSLFEVAAPAKV